MKTMKLFLLATFMVTALNTQAQVAVKVDRTYGVKAPAWAPKAPVQTQYYYLPDIQTYYDVPARRYIYQKDGNWVRTASLPTQYKGYNLYKGQTVYLTDYKGNAPYKYYGNHKVKYAGKKWKRNGHDNGNHYGQYKNKGKHHGNDHEDGNELEYKKNRDRKDYDEKDRDEEGHDGKDHGKGKGHGKK